MDMKSLLVIAAIAIGASARVYVLLRQKRAIWPAKSQMASDKR
jgi:hypothetical protein